MSSVEGSIFGIGNPLLDISVEADDTLFARWEVAPGQTSLATDAQKALYAELVGHPTVAFIAGGAAQNTIRGAQWLLKTPGATTYTGAVGKDETAQTLRSTASAAGVKTLYHETDKDATGSCAVLVKSSERSLIANIAAANHFHSDHLDTPEVAAAIERARVFYGTGFLLTLPHGTESLVKLGKHCKENGKTFVFNLSAPFLIDFFWDQMQAVIPYADYVMCNEHEASAFAKKSGWDENDRRGAAAKLAALPKENAAVPRTVLFTQGPEATIVFTQGQVREYKPIEVEPHKIVDLNGAGDAFAAGIIAGLARGVDLEEAINAGHYAAYHVVQRSGASYPDTADFAWSK